MGHRERLSTCIINAISSKQVMRIKKHISKGKLVDQTPTSPNTNTNFSKLTRTVRKITNEILGMKELSVQSRSDAQAQFFIKN